MSKKAQKRRLTRARDPILEEFETKDLGDDLRVSNAGRFVRPSSRTTSIVLDDDLIALLKAKGAKRGLGYQTMLKVIVREHINDY